MKYLFFALAAAFIPTVFAHGWVSHITVDGTDYPGPPVATGAKDEPQVPRSPIRQLADNMRVGNLSSTEMACGRGSPGPANQVIDVIPGAKVTYAYKNIPNPETGGKTTWIHKLGPVSLYIASCSANCDPASATWYKIGQLGFKDADNWYEGDLYNGQTLSFQLPDSLPQGDYLLRSEIIAIHTSPGEIYPACTQIHFTSDGSLIVSPSNGVKFPGAYTGDEPGFKTFSINSGVDATNYVFPGPPLSNIAKGNEVSLNGGSLAISGQNVNASNNNSPSPPAAASSSAAAVVTPAAVPTPAAAFSSPNTTVASGKTCKRRRSNVPRVPQPELNRHRKARRRLSGRL
ncbi:lytic polysaccharide monooxygenase [Sphaerobolus stellatus SS14]|uniref:lytic cellulose monooxygenase (C4-dehydrogenating) n=1 Tax=Sphaerobolus stellatus (strain SS14) TaxID=990650 RepID=A0A0C9THG8_SPHS4|nr:lytic polysaccharide monooxygenase [Sphaerobolus stellatus SS14]